MSKKISKIVVTGGPCAGKSTGMSWIQNAFTKRGYKVIFVAESAAELINSGVQPWSFSNIEFQSAILNTQLAKEHVYEEIAKNSNYEKILLVFDRGTIDGKAFSEPGVFEQIVKNVGKTENELINNYDAVFHLVTAAKGAEEFYTLENNSARSETVEQARVADDRLLTAWNGHRHFRIIGNEENFKDKMSRLIDEIAISLGEPKSFETKKKYLIKYPDISMLEQMENVEKVEVNQTYLKCSDDEKIQIRMRGSKDNYIYYQTRVRIQNGQLLQVEKRLTQEEYEEKLKNADPTRKQLHRTRYCFTEQNQYIEIDIYPFWDDKAILNVDSCYESDKVQLPDFVEAIEDITGNKEYLNSELSKK